MRHQSLSQDGSSPYGLYIYIYNHPAASATELFTNMIMRGQKPTLYTSSNNMQMVCLPAAQKCLKGLGAETPVMWF